MKGRGVKLMEDLREQMAKKAIIKAADDRDKSGTPLPGDAELLAPYRQLAAGRASYPALLADLRNKHQQPEPAKRNVGRGSLLTQTTPTTTTPTTDARTSGSPRATGVQSVASSVTFEPTGAIPKGRGIGTLQHPHKYRPNHLLNLANIEHDQTVFFIKSADGTPLVIPGIPRKGVSTALSAVDLASEMPSSISGPPVGWAATSNISTPTQVSTPPRPQMVQVPGTPDRTHSKVPTPIISGASTPTRAGMCGAPCDEEPLIHHTDFRGDKGKPQQVEANYVRLEMNPAKGFNEYVVDFNPVVDSRNERHRLVRQQANVIGKAYNFDGNRLFLPFILPEVVTNCCSQLSTNGSDVTVSFRFNASKMPNDPERIYLYNILFRKIMTILKFTQMNRNFYDPKGVHDVPKHKLEVWPGYVNAINEYDGGIYLQCDVSHRILRAETAYDILSSIIKRGSKDFKTEAEKALVGCIVLTKHNNMSYKIDEIDFSMSPMSTFRLGNDQELTFVDYYRQKYCLNIKDKDQPLLVHRPRDKTSHESDITRLVCLVPEMCNLTGLTDAMKNDFNLMKSVGDFTRVSPSDRQAALVRFVKRIEESPEAKELLASWGLRLAREGPISLSGRLLDSEVLMFGGGYKERVNPAADFTRAATSKPCLVSKPLTKWILVYLKKNEEVVRTFFNSLQVEGKKLGIEVTVPELVKLENDRTETYLKAIRGNTTVETKMVVAVVPAQRSDRYAAIKKLCYIENPVANQVIVTKTISNDRKLTSVVQKIALQINCKLGGELWACNSPLKKIMVIGIDVYHDTTNKSTGRNSIAGFVSSLNDGFTRWHSSVAIQKPKQELVDGLRASFVGALTAYYHVNNEFPATIVVFRDGVGDSQLLTTTKHEVTQLMTCFRDISKDYKPAFGFVVVQKRINTRIFALLNNGLNNPTPGTVVDHTITRRNIFDFFLVSQKVNQGTVTPTHMVVLKDSPSLSPSLLQKLAYQLTHMYFNWTGTVRVPAPCQYAHKLANMVGENLHNLPSPELSDRLFYL